MFFYWKHKLKNELVTQMLPEIVPLTQPSIVQTVSKESCTTCTTFKPTACARIYINGISIEIDSSASDSFITTLKKRCEMFRDANPGSFAGIHIVCGYTDLRLGIDSLAAIIEK